jgi:anti-sigma regulatory factor (Ser/Thr protein kinase)
MLQARTTLPAGMDTPAAARAFVRESAARTDIDVEDLTLVVSELVTTAVVSGSSTVEVGLVGDDHHVLVEVVEDAPSSASLTPLVEPDTSAAARGLMLVSRVAERWGVRRDGIRKVFWADLAAS